MGVITKLTTRARAHAAAVTHRWPAKKMQIILVSGADGSDVTIVALANILRKQDIKVGIIASQFVRIAEERVEGSDQADVLSDPFRMQALLAQMRRARCRYVIVEVPNQLPAHGFSGLQPVMVVMRRSGDSHLTEVYTTGRKAAWQRIMDLHPQFVAVNRDDPGFTPVAGQAEITTMTFGAHEKAECRITSVEMHPKGCAITLLVDHQTDITLTTVLTGKIAIYSVIAAASAAYLLHTPILAIEEGISELPAQAGVAHYLPIERPYQIALDGAITPDGIAETLETFKHFTKNRLIAVVGAHLGQSPEWRSVIGEIIAGFADRIIVTDGEYAAEESAGSVRQQMLQGIVAAGADARADEVPDRHAAFEKALSIARRGDTIIVLASTQRPYRQVGTERLPWSDIKKIEELLA